MFFFVGRTYGAADKKRRTLSSSSSSSSGPGVAMISGVLTSIPGVGAGALKVRGVGGGSICNAAASFSFTFIETQNVDEYMNIFGGENLSILPSHS